MKYTYAYKTSDGVRHEATMEAESRDAVFVALRQRGIKAIKVVAADGSKANGEIRGIRKRWLVAAALIGGMSAVLLVLSSQTLKLSNAQTFKLSNSQTLKPSNQLLARPLPRQAILGDRKRVENPPEDLRNAPVESFLARFAEPGRPFSAPERDWPNKAAFEAALEHPLTYAADEFTEHVDLKRMVEGLKREMRLYLRAGGLASGYIRELIWRQQLEISYREKAEKRIANLLKEKKNAPAYDYWLKANAQLESMGIWPLPLPDELRGKRPDFDFDE